MNEQIAIQEIMDHTGCTLDEAAGKIKSAKVRLGITTYDYIKYKLYDVPEQMQARKYISILKKSFNNKLKLRERNWTFFSKLISKTGWNYEQALESYNKAKELTGVSMAEYYFYHFYELDESTQQEVFIASKSALLRKRYDTKTSANLTNNKIQTNELFDAFLHRKWSTNRITEEEFLNKYSECSQIIYKPVEGGQGKGIESYDIDPDNIKYVFEEISNKPLGVVEEFVVQHKVLKELCPSSVNTIRFVTLSSTSTFVTEDGKKLDIAYASLRIGGGETIVDNFHSGGMVVGIDLSSGIIVTDAADEEGNFFEEHPKTKVRFKGIKIPYFDEAKAMVLEMIKFSKIEGYIGWDVAISENGPVLIEINHNPGPMLLTAPYINEKKGMMPLMKKYLF